MSLRHCPQCGLHYSGSERFCPRDGSLLEPIRHADDPQWALTKGTVIGGRYRIVRKLGSGAMGSVYLAIQETLGREVAIKVLLPEMDQDGDGVSRFLLEARAAGRVDHPNVVSVFDFGRDPKGNYFLVMEYVTGQLLGDLIEREAPLDQRRTIHLLRQILSAVALAHEQQIIHRDLKPQNIICTTHRGDRDFVKVLDFGIAKILGDGGGPVTQGVVLGTPEYMAPEQIKGKPLDPRCDLYAVGVMAYEMLTGKLPFMGTIEQIFYQHLNARVRSPRELRPDLHPDLEFLVLTLMAKRRDGRFSRAEAVLNVLARIGRELEEEVGRQRIPQTMVLQNPGVAQSLPTAFEELSTTSAWEIPDLMSELCRLAQLWERRVTEVADALWGPVSRPSQVGRWLGSIREGERCIGEHETRIAVLRHEVEELDAAARNAEAALRMKRLDLVAQQGGIWAVLEDAKTRAMELPEARDLPVSPRLRRDTLPSRPPILEDEGERDEPNQEDWPTNVNITLPEAVGDEPRVSGPGEHSGEADEDVPTSVGITLPEAAKDRVYRPPSPASMMARIQSGDDPGDTILSEYADLYDPAAGGGFEPLEPEPDEPDTLPTSGESSEPAREAFARLEREIAAVDEELGRTMEDHGREVAEREAAIVAEVAEVNRERERLAPIYRDLAEFVTDQALQRSDLQDHLDGLDQVSRALQYHQFLLQRVQTK